MIVGAVVCCQRDDRVAQEILSSGNFPRFARTARGAPHLLTLTEAGVSVKNSHVPCCAIANGPCGPTAGRSDVALLGRAGMPVWVGIVRPAEPLAATLAVLLRAMVARFIHARRSLAGLFLCLYGSARHNFLHGTMRCCGRGDQRAGSTTPTLFTPLQAIYTRPSAVAAILRTVPPPEGIVVRAIVSVLGSKRISVFGFTPDSLYQTIPSGVIAMPYGFDPGPPGDGHILTSPFFGSSRPRCPRS